MKISMVGFLICILFCAFFSPLFTLAQEVQKQQVEISQQEEHEKIIPSPQDIKESTGIFVLIGWIWLVIFILIYILRLKIKEVDRLYQIKYFSSKED